MRAVATWAVLALLTGTAIAEEIADDLADVGPILLMHLNESEGTTTFQDSSGSNLDGTCTSPGCPTRGAFGKFNPALTFDGADDQITGIALGAAGTSDWTISAWIRTTNVGAGMVLTNRPAAGDTSMSLHVGWFAGAATNNGAAYYSLDGNGCEWGAQGTSNLTNGNFHHLVGTRTSLGTYRIYVNGTLEGDTNVSAGAGCQNASAFSTHTWIIGNGPAWGGSQWVGQIAEVSVYDRALTRGEIRSLYRRQLPRFLEVYDSSWVREWQRAHRPFPWTPVTVSDARDRLSRTWAALLR